MKKVFILILLATSGALSAQVAANDSSLYDFWIGTWELNWTDQQGEKGTGINYIQRVMDGNVIEEKFKAITGSTAGFEGQSWSVLDANAGTWKQTWVDNQGGYLDFVGKVDGEDRIFERSFEKDGQKVIQRMVFRNITTDSFVWDWQRKVGDEEWKSWWMIHYKRIGR